ncbi:MAG: NUDIX hydrolase [Rhizobiales bacterium]|nr:NUDIX hydrolase [Hyphomicrobiales bacterium]OJY42869.1 MAG: hypothetical protein BGP08_19320 [Rhizobiales bacterium 64-17]
MNLRVAQPGGNEVKVDAVRALDIALGDVPWRFEREKNETIAAHFARLRKSKPALWNGPVLLFRDCVLVDGVFRAEAFRTDYASFLAWLDGLDGGTETAAGVRNCFACPVVKSSDGAFLLGVMAPHTANAGQVYFPCGTPDFDDLVDGRVDLDSSVARELREETGLLTADLAPAPGWIVVSDGPYVALLRRFRSALSSDALRDNVRATLQAEPNPELSDIVMVRDRAGITNAMPPFVQEFLRQILDR